MKERLTGAIILVALLVLLVPELLTGPSAKSSARPAGDDSAPVRTYTIDLADDPAANRRANANPAPAPETAVTDEPVAQATPEQTAPEAGQPEVPAVDEPAPDDLGVAHGSSADAAAADRSGEQKSVVPESGSADLKPALPGPKAAAPEPERPRSAFGPAATARSESQPKPAAPSAEASRPRTSATNGSSGQSGSRSAAPPAGKPTGSSSAGGKGWSVQLGAFGSRENAERLVKQVKGKGFAAAINENPSSKLRYRVRVGSERDRGAADALAAKLRAAGQKDATVVPIG